VEDHRARLFLDPHHVVGRVDPRLYGSFVEHMGRCVYDGIYEPSHPGADAQGFRSDVLHLVRELDVPIVRYPGGNFVSGYRWEDGVGPAGERPSRLDLAWRSTETNQFGLHEFANWCRTVGTDMMLAVNLGTRGVDAARALVEYANHPRGTAWSDLRIGHGAPDPFGVRTWCLGNEVDGPWQIGHKTADEYARLAVETAKAMKWVDPSIELVACGSSGPSMPTFPDWDRIVLEQTYDHVEYISVHRYLNRKAGLGDYLASGLHTDAHIEAVIATCDHVRARKRSSKTLHLAFDEWNVTPTRHEGPGKEEPEDWPVAPPIAEGTYDVVDAVAFGGMMLSLLRHADRVRIGCLAQLVNVLGPVKTRTGGAAWPETIYHPYLHGSRWGRGTVLDVVVDSPTTPVDGLGDVPTLDAVAVRADDGTLTVFAINRAVDTELTLTVDLRAFAAAGGGGAAGAGGGAVEVVESLTMYDADHQAYNSPEEPHRVTPRALATQVENSAVTARLAPVSWNVLRCRVPAEQ
jgi:alpha-L-arabinofuranosidase